MSSLILFDILDGLGAGEQVMVAAVMVLVVLYMFRARRVAGKSVSLAGTGWVVFVSVSTAAALAIFLGWVDPSPGEFVHDVLGFVGWAAKSVWEPVADFLRGLVA